MGPWFACSCSDDLSRASLVSPSSSVEYWGMQSKRIETERLRLLALRPDDLRLALSNPDELERKLGFPVSRSELEGPVRRAMELKLEKMQAAPADEMLWLTYWLIVAKAEPFGAGFAGFKGLDPETGEAEIGYGIDRAVRSCGYTTEAVRALIAWAFDDSRCCAVIAPGTLRGNAASHRVLEKAGMRRVRESAETIDWRIEKDSG